MFVNVPKGFVLKKYSNYKYFYDKIGNIGFPFYYKGDNWIKSIYNNNNLDLKTELFSINKGVNIYKVKDKYRSKTLDSILLKKFPNEKYIYIYIEIDQDKNIPEFMEFYKDKNMKKNKKEIEKAIKNQLKLSKITDSKKINLKIQKTIKVPDNIAKFLNLLPNPSN